MILALDFSSETPIYQQIRNEIVIGISNGSLAEGERLPTIRALAAEIGVNTMTVNKAYDLLKKEGYISADRRSGARVMPRNHDSKEVSKEIGERLKLLISEARLNGVKKETFITLCEQLYKEE